MKNLGMILLAVWLIIFGVVSLTGFDFPASDIVMALIAIIAGILLLVNRRRIRSAGKYGVILLGIWLILNGFLPLININFPAGEVILAAMAALTGVLLLLRR